MTTTDINKAVCAKITLSGFYASLFDHEFILCGTSQTEQIASYIKLLILCQTYTIVAKPLGEPMYVWNPKENLLANIHALRSREGKGETERLFYLVLSLTRRGDSLLFPLSFSLPPFSPEHFMAVRHERKELHSF